MTAQWSAQSGGRFFNGPTILLAVAFLLPALIPGLFGWTSGMMAIPVFYFLKVDGERQGGIEIRNSILLAGAGALVLQQLPVMLFSLTLIPLAYSLNRSAAAGEGEVRTGIRGVIVLGVSWLVFWAVYGIILSVNPYTHLLKTLDSGFAQLYEIYSQNGNLPADTLLNLEQVIHELRRLIPIILPGMLACSVIMTVWMNMVGANSLLQRLRPDLAPWRKYSHWRLPDRIVWLPIVAGVALTVGSGIVKNVAIGILLVSALLYFFQGLAVLIHLLDKWKVPLYIRILIYGIIVLQGYGLFVLVITGVADVWIDFRHRHDNKQHPDN
ncbi:hypothetical protein MNBD_DELTA04-742 [hydrothermal vent metagenome]|uniref:DUF2232 domain-containing protein n=1 Tax=hydrothermal vent metagenome TaxID=652676 RepID=A0A3B0VAH0_9ZZZZ